MKKITIEGKFTGSNNNFVILDVFRSNSEPFPFDFRKIFKGNFKEVIKDLRDDLSYSVDFTGFTTGKFELKISGDFLPSNPITDSYEKDSFSPGYFIKTTK